MNERDRIRWARALHVVGWLFVLAYLGELIGQIRRAAATTQSSFEDGVWGQRIELVSFATLPSNLAPMIAAVAAAVAGSLLVRSLVDPVVVHLARLTRIIAGLAIVVAGLAVLGIVGVFLRNYDPVTDVGALLGRLGGVAIAAATIRLCLEVEHDT